MKIAVSGATGFLGRALCSLLVSDGHDVVALVRSSVAPCHDSVERRICDLSGDVTADLFEGVEAVAHLAAFLPSSYDDAAQASECLQINALGSLKLAIAAAAAGLQRFVYVSSGNAYAPLGRTPVESDPLYPSRASYYLASKVCGELYVQQAVAKSMTAAVILRPSAIYGAGMKGGLVHALANRLFTGQSVVLQDEGLYKADLVHVDDVAIGVSRALTANVRGAFNIGSGVASTSRRVADVLASLAGAESSRISVQPARAQADLGFFALDIARARTELRYEPRTLEKGLSDYVRAAFGATRAS